MLATWGLVPIGLTVFLIISRNLGMVKYAQKLDAKRAQGKTTEMTEVKADAKPSKKDD